MLQQPNSFVHHFVQSEVAALEKMMSSKKTRSIHSHNRVLKERNIAIARRFPVKTAVSSSAFYRYTHENNMAIRVTPILPTERHEGVPLHYFGFFIKAGHITLFILLGNTRINEVLMVACGQGLNVFSVWWIGSAKSKLPHLSSHAVVGVYVGLVCGYGLLSFLGCLLITYMSIRTT